MRIRPFSLRLRLLTLLSLGIAPVAVFSTLLTVHEWKEARADGVDTAERIAHRIAGEARDQQDAAWELMLGLALSGRADPTSKVCDAISGIGAGDEGSRHVGVADSLGHVTCAYPALERPPLEGHSHITAAVDSALATGAPVARDCPGGPGRAGHGVVLAYPVAGPTQTVAYVLFVEIDRRWIPAFIERVGPPPGTIVTLVDGTGQVFQSFPANAVHLGEPLPAALGDREGEFVFGSAPLRRDGGAGDPQVTVGLPRLSVYSEFTWFGTSVLVLLLASTVALWLTWWGTRVAILEPVGRLSRAMVRVATGDLCTRSEIDRRGTELGGLGAAFDAMADALRAREAELQALARQLMNARETERVAIARELHDELGQSLLALKLDAAWIRGRIGKGAAVEDDVRKLEDGLEQVMDVTRRVSADLRPPILDDLGLTAAMRSMAEDFQKRTGIRCTLDIDEGVRIRGGSKGMAIFRIFQEALTNVAKHAEAPSAMVSLRRRNQDVVLEVADFGKGLPRDHKRGLGLAGMVERARSEGGCLTVTSPPEGGVLVHAEIPLQETKQSE